MTTMGACDSEGVCECVCERECLCVFGGICDAGEVILVGFKGGEADGAC